MSFDGFIKRQGFWLNDFLHGSRVGRYYRDMQTVMPDKQRGYPIQQRHLQEMLAYAVANCPFYHYIEGITGGGN